jgi:uncharacterized membrane protein YdbT with pleckstrin-like domain
MPGLAYVLCAVAATLVFRLAPVPAALAGPVLIPLWILVALLIALHSLGSVLWYRHGAYAYDPGMLIIRQGGYSQVTTIIPRRKLQWAFTRQNPFQRLAGVATICAYTAAGTGGTATMLRDLRASEAAAYLDWVRPHRREPANQSNQSNP